VEFQPLAFSLQPFMERRFIPLRLDSASAEIAVESWK
jgi:hypothetical protein